MWHLNYLYLGIFSAFSDWVQKTLNTGGYDKTTMDNALKTLTKIRPYLHFNDAVGQIFNWIKWGIVKLCYNLAEAAQSLSTQALDYRNLLKDAGLQKYVNLIVGASAAIMIVVLVWIGLKYLVGKEQMPVQSVILQVIISVFLIFNISTITNWGAEQASNFYHDALSEKDGSKKTNSIPFNLVAKNTNDLAYMFYNNWPGYGVKSTGKIKQQYREHFGHNGWIDSKGNATDQGQDAFEQLSPNDLAFTITPDQAKDMQDAIDKENKGKVNTQKVKVTYLQYRLIDGGDSPSVIKVTKSNVPFSNAFKGGYSRYSLPALPVCFCLICVAIAFFFITFMIIKTFLDLAIMQIIGVLVFSTDLDSGKKTKMVMTDIMTACITIVLQAVELMFYQIIANWIAAQNASGNVGFALMCVGFLAATIMLFTGSSKTAKFFGVDTGAQHGFAMGAIALNQTAGLARKGAQAGRAVLGAGHFATQGARHLKDNAQAGRARVNAKNKVWSEGASKLADKPNRTPMEKISDAVALHRAANMAGDMAAQAARDTKSEFLDNGGSRRNWNRAVRSGEAGDAINSRYNRMRDRNGLNDREHNALEHAKYGDFGYQDVANNTSDANAATTGAKFASSKADSATNRMNNNLAGQDTKPTTKPQTDEKLRDKINHFGGTRDNAVNAASQIHEAGRNKNFTVQKDPDQYSKRIREDQPKISEVQDTPKGRHLEDILHNKPKQVQRTIHTEGDKTTINETKTDEIRHNRTEAHKISEHVTNKKIGNRTDSGSHEAGRKKGF